MSSKRPEAPPETAAAAEPRADEAVARPKKRTPAEKRRQKAPAPPKPQKKIGAPSVWTPELEDAIAASLETTGCSFRDAAELNGISFEALKARQRTGDAFATRIARVKLARKPGAVACVQSAIAGGDWRAAVWYLAAHWPDEYARSAREGVALAPPDAGGVTNVSLTVVQQLVADPARRAEIGALGEHLRLAAVAERDRTAVPAAPGALRHVGSAGRRDADPGTAPQRDLAGGARGGGR